MSGSCTNVTKGKICKSQFFGQMKPFKLNGKINLYNCVYWTNENLNIVEENIVNHTVYGLSSRGLIVPYFFEETVTGETYLQMLEIMIPRLNDFLENENEVYFQQDGASPNFHVNVRNFFNRKFCQKWIGRRGCSTEFPP